MRRSFWAPIHLSARPAAMSDRSLAASQELTNKPLKWKSFHSGLPIRPPPGCPLLWEAQWASTMGHHYNCHSGHDSALTPPSQSLQWVLPFTKNSMLETHCSYHEFPGGLEIQKGPTQAPVQPKAPYPPASHHTPVYFHRTRCRSSPTTRNMPGTSTL